jgi:hypothetical protein
MRHQVPAAAAMLLLNAIALAPPAMAQSTTPTITYIPGSSVKLYQINGDCDWVQWDATITNETPTCKPTTSKTATQADVLGDDVATSFENNGELIMMFGDTIGATSTNYPTYINFENPFNWMAHDPIARSTTQHAEDGLLLNFFLDGDHGLEVGKGTAIDMGADNVPDAGISLNGQIYISAKTGTTTDGMGNSDGSNAYAVLVRFDETSQTFTSGRTTSALPGGHFVTVSFYEPPTQPDVVMFGLGAYRASNVYLSMIPSSEFWSGVDSNGQSATSYFTGLSNGQPMWSLNESDSVPIVTDVDPANPTIGNLSAFYSQQLGLWLMTYDGGRGSETTNGTYFTYAPQPWGPWSAPQLIFSGCRDKALGNFIFYPGNFCPTATLGGPAGPTINPAVNDPLTTKGGAYAPLMVERFTEIAGNSLKIFYTLSTWNPYAAVLIESDFTIAPAFFSGEVGLGSGVEYLQFPNGNVFGYYNLSNFPIFYHYDLGFEAFVDGGNGSAFLYDFTSAHWFYTSPSLFPYLYDFTLNAWLYYFPDTKSPGHYTSNPRYFSNLTTGKVFTM